MHPSQHQLHITPIPEPLYLVSAVSNPERWYSRYKNYHIFQKHIEDSGAILYTVELAFGDRLYELTSQNNHRHIRVRSRSELWHKENLINIGISRLPESWKYAAYLDADIVLTRPDWVVETVHQLQHYDWVQLFSTYSDLLPDGTSGRPLPSFMKLFRDGLPSESVAERASYGRAGRQKGQLWGAPGGGWAFRREAIDRVGGLLDVCILGSGDYHMTVALVGSVNRHTDLRMGLPGYEGSIREWSQRASSPRMAVGYLNSHALHHWHGPRDSRGYAVRSEILKRHQFDPTVDLRRDTVGVLHWSGNKPDLEEDVRQYFRSRDEDS